MAGSGSSTRITVLRRSCGAGADPACRWRFPSGCPVLGVVFAFGYPDETGYLVARAEGCGRLLRNGAPLDCALMGRSLAAGELVAVSHASAEAAAANARLVESARFLLVPSVAYRLALVAYGDVVAGCSINGVFAWDVAVEHALLVGDGHVFLDDAGRPVVFRRDGASNLHGCLRGAREVVLALISRDWRRTSRRSAAPSRTSNRRRP